MRVTVVDELWVSQDEQGHMILHTPTVPGAPGLMQKPPKVLAPGTTLFLLIDRRPIGEPETCRGCEQMYQDNEEGKLGSRAYEHNHGIQS